MDSGKLIEELFQAVNRAEQTVPQESATTEDRAPESAATTNQNSEYPSADGIPD